MTGFHRKKKFVAGTPLLDEVTAAYLNSVEERLNRLEKLSVVPPLTKSEAGFGAVLALAAELEEIELVRLTENLEPYTEGNAALLSLTEFLSASSSSETDIPLVEEDESLNVLEINGSTSVSGTNGLALKFKRSSDGVWIFVPWPLAQGDHLPRYDASAKQALIHAANGYLEWMNINVCGSSSSGL